MVRALKFTVWSILILGALSLLGAIGSNAYIKARADGRIYDTPSAPNIPTKTVAIVPGAHVRPSGKPSASLRDRLDTARQLWERGRVSKILVSGDHRSPYYNEVKAMSQWLMRRGVPREAIYLDHAGLRTHDTMQRAARVFKVEDAIICTQAFHLSRSIYLARAAGIDAVGVVADQRPYSERVQRVNTVREFAARTKAMLDIYILHTRPQHLGETIPITGPSAPTYDY